MKLPRKFGIVAFWLSWPGLWLYLRGSQRTRLLICCGNQILVTRTWMGDGRWSLPGGGLHRHEDKISGLLREVREEIGVRLSTASLRPLTSAVYRAHGLRFQCHYFMTTLKQRPALRLQQLEISDAQWVDIDSVTPQEFAPDVLTAVAAARQTLSAEPALLQ